MKHYSTETFSGGMKHMKSDSEFRSCWDECTHRHTESKLISKTYLYFHFFYF